MYCLSLVENSLSFNAFPCNQIVDEIFHFFTKLWRDVKVQEKTEEDTKSQLYKFRPRPFKLDNAYEIDLSSLSSSFSGDNFSEWKESLYDEESAQKVNPQTLCVILSLIGDSI